MLALDLARNEKKEAVSLNAAMANRHGLIAGATGTGKSITVRKMAESFSNVGVPVFVVDVKGDFSGLAKAGDATGKVAEKVKEFKLGADYYQAFPVTFWDVYGQNGIPLRLKVSAMGPLLLAKLLDLNATQEGLLNLVFKVADDNQWELIDLKDLRALLKHVAEHAAGYQSTYGNVSAASVGAIQRQLLQLEKAGGDELFGEPALAFGDLMQVKGAQGVINILEAQRLMTSARIFGAWLLWLIAALFEELPEVGDLEKPKFALFFDEAHLLFTDLSPALEEQIERVVRLIRSKGVGVYFCTQSPLDLPEAILGQLGNRVQHALRAFTPKDQKAALAAAKTFRPNPDLDVAATISVLGVGEALISFLDETGTPHPVQKCWVLPPASRLTPLTAAEQDALCTDNPLFAKYHTKVDNYSAFEALNKEEASTSADNEKAEKEGKTPTQSASARATPSRAQKAKPGMFSGFVKGLFGIRKDTRAGLEYDVSHQLGKEVKNSVSKNLTKAINRGLMGVIKKK